MSSRFFVRNLSESVRMLERMGLCEEEFLRISSKEQAAITLQNSRMFLHAYSLLLCDTSKMHLKTPVFCMCCSQSAVFIRNNSLRLLFKQEARAHRMKNLSEGYKEPTQKIITSQGYQHDTFSKYLIAAFTLDSRLLLDVIREEPLFWDACLLLIELTDAYIEIGGPLSEAFRLTLKIERDYDSPFNLPLSVKDKNLQAAYLYSKGETDESYKIFNSLFSSQAFIFDFRYFEMFAQILYVKNDKRLSQLAEAVSNDYKSSPEAQCILGIHKMQLGAYLQAKTHFYKSLSRRDSPDVLCMLGHAYARLGSNNDARHCFMAALSPDSENFRILYSVAQGFFVLEEFSRSIFYCQKALLIRSDGSVWKLMGKALTKDSDTKESLEKAIRCFDKAIELGERDAMLYRAEYLVRSGDIPAAVALYEEYLEYSTLNRDSIARYLAEYYDDIGDYEKSIKYRSMQATE